MYCDGLGLQVLGSFEGHDGFDGVMVGPAGGTWHFEFTHCREHVVRPTPTPEDLMVLYIGDPVDWRSSCETMLEAGFAPVPSFNPYWDARGRTFQDPDGYRVVLQNAEWKDPSSARQGTLNRESYDTIATTWDEARVSLPERERVYFDTFLEGLACGSSILDLGCGTGRPIAEELLARGYRVTGVDQSAGMLGIAQSRLPAGTWVEARLEDYEPAEVFDGIVCWDAMFHIERSWHRSLLRRMAGMLRDGGRLMLTAGGSDNPAFTDTMHGETFFYDSHPPEQLMELVRAAGFEPVLAEYTNLPTTGRDKGRYAIVARRAGVL